MHKISLNTLFKDKQIIFFGDDHDMNQGRNWLADQIEKCSEKIDFLALEYVESSKQKLLENDNHGKLKKYLQKTYLDFPGFMPDSILNIVTVCKKKGIRVQGIEMPEDSFTDWTDKNAQLQRVEYLIHEIKNLLPLGKGIVLTGADHAEKREHNVYGKIRSELIDNSKILSVLFIGGKNWTVDTNEYYIRKLELEAINTNRALLLFDFPVKDNAVPADWVIHFPQTEEIQN